MGSIVFGDQLRGEFKQYLIYFQYDIGDIHPHIRMVNTLNTLLHACPILDPHFAEQIYDTCSMVQPPFFFNGSFFSNPQKDRTAIPLTIGWENMQGIHLTGRRFR